jgi:hypothetical protein
MTTVANSYQVKFHNNVELVLQQATAGNPLEAAVVWTDEAGAEKCKVRDIFAAKRAKEATERHGRTVWDDPDNDGVWIPKTNELYEAFLIDHQDQLQTAISLQGAATQVTAATINRARIQRILEGFYGPIISGKAGTTSTPLGSQGEVAVTTGGASGAQPMNTKKLREAKIYLGENFNQKGLKRYMILTEEDNDALLDEVPATSTDFQRAFGASVDENGNLVRMLGFEFIHLELDDPNLVSIPDLATNGSGHRRNPFWVQGGLAGNYWQRLRSEVGKIPELRFNLGTFAGTTLAATRTQAPRCGTVLNKKA